VILAPVEVALVTSHNVHVTFEATNPIEPLLELDVRWQ
jgi:hypothetical protein